jgi:hypothetical protein
MSEQPTAMPPGKVFVGSLFAGLMWGVIAAVLFSSLIMGAVAYSSVKSTPIVAAVQTVAMTFWWMTAFACAVAVFPIGPTAVLLGWRLYRAGVVSPWRYAGVGAISALTAPLLVLIVFEARMPTVDWATGDIRGFDAIAVFLIACFVPIGAFGGYMAGRMIRRAAA